MAAPSPSRASSRPKSDEEDDDESPYGSHLGYFLQSHSGGDEAFGPWRGRLRHLGTMTSLPEMQIIAENSQEGSISSSQPSELEDEDNSEETSDAECGGGGLYEWCPGFYEWIVDRTPPRAKLAIVCTFLLLDSSRFLMFEYALVGSINTLSVFVTADLLSLTLALGLSFTIEGSWGLKKIFAWHSLWRFLSISVLFVVAQSLNAMAYRTGLSAALMSMLGKVYLPVVAGVSFFAFRRHYGKLEWLAMAMLMLGIAAFILLRDRCHLNNCDIFHLSSVEENFGGIGLVLLSVCASAVASILAERLYKDRSLGLLRARERRGRQGQTNRYWIYRAQLDIWTTLLWILLWAGQIYMLPAQDGRLDGGVVAAALASPPLEFGRLFGSWTKRQYVLVLVLVGQSWFAGLAVQHFSTVSKAVVQSISTVLVVCIGDSMEHGKYQWGERFTPSILITVIVLLSALIFQTGRINMKKIRQRLSSEAATHMVSQPAEVAREIVKHVVSKGRPRKEEFLGILVKYSVVIAYILADSVRSVLMSVVQANRFFVPQTMQIMSAVCGILLSSALTLKNVGPEGLKQAWDIKKIYRFALCGFLGAVSGTLISMAYALGTSPALVVALGKVYTPLSAVFSRWILGKYFIWLEWFALVILTAASFAFGILETLGKAHGGPGSPISGMVCVIASATASCLFSLVMEKLMKGERDPFIMQKVRLDVGTLIFSIMFLPIIGGIGMLPSNTRHDVAFWTLRPGPDYWACHAVAVDHPNNALRGCDEATGLFMANATLIAGNPALAETASHCVCGSGIFLGWGSNPMIYVALCVVVFHSWITGVLVSTFSSVYRAVADGFPVLLIYFFLDPLASRIPVDSFQNAYTSGPQHWPPLDWARDLVCLIIPLSANTFTSAAAEMQNAAMETTGRSGRNPDDALQPLEPSDDSSGDDEDEVEPWAAGHPNGEDSGDNGSSR